MGIELKTMENGIMDVQCQRYIGVCPVFDASQLIGFELEIVSKEIAGMTAVLINLLI